MLNAGQTLDVSVPMSTTGPVQKMEPLTNVQVAIKNSVDIFYFACIAPLHIFFSEEGAMEKKTFLNTWKDIPAANEIQHTIEGVECTSDGISTKMTQNNVSFMTLVCLRMTLNTCRRSRLLRGRSRART